MNHAQAKRLAESLVDILRPACERIEIAGSIRRGKAEVKDAEIIAIPRVDLVPGAPTLFGSGEPRELSALWVVVDTLVERGDLERHPPIGGRAAPWGDRYRKLMFHGLPVDLFTATPDTWGAIALVRTGPADFSREWVTALRREGYRMEGGQVLNEVGHQVAVPDEASAFALAGWRYVPARDRRSA